MKIKNQNKFYRARVLTLMIVLRNIYQIFRRITLLKHMLITNQYVITLPSRIDVTSRQIIF